MLPAAAAARHFLSLVAIQVDEEMSWLGDGDELQPVNREGTLRERRFKALAIRPGVSLIKTRPTRQDQIPNLTSRAI